MPCLIRRCDAVAPRMAESLAVAEAIIARPGFDAQAVRDIIAPIGVELGKLKNATNYDKTPVALPPNVATRMDAIDTRLQALRGRVNAQQAPALLAEAAMGNSYEQLLAAQAAFGDFD